MKTKILLLALLLPISNGMAELLVHESFDYPAGAPLLGQSGGIGWSAPHVTSDSNPFRIAPSGLTYEGLSTSGNSAVASYPGHVAVSSIVRDFEPISSDYYMSFLIQIDSIRSIEDHHLKFKLIETPDTRIQFGKARGYNNLWVEFVYPDVFELPYSFESGKTHLILVHHSKDASGGTHTFSVWIDPSLSEDLGAPIFSRTIPGPGGKPVGVRTYDTFFGPGHVAYDEIRIGTALADVLPEAVEEPDCCEENLLRIQQLETRVAELQQQLLSLLDHLESIDSDFSEHVHDKGSTGRYTSPPAILGTEPE